MAEQHTRCGRPVKGPVKWEPDWCPRDNTSAARAEGVSAGSRRVGPFEHGRFGEGLTNSLDNAPGGDHNLGLNICHRAAYQMFHYGQMFLPSNRGYGQV
jgi:hypothetical protein